jgi:hypothetical protein
VVPTRLGIGSTSRFSFRLSAEQNFAITGFRRPHGVAKALFAQYPKQRRWLKGCDQEQLVIVAKTRHRAHDFRKGFPASSQIFADIQCDYVHLPLCRRGNRLGAVSRRLLHHASTLTDGPEPRFDADQGPSRFDATTGMWQNFDLSQGSPWAIHLFLNM